MEKLRRSICETSRRKSRASMLDKLDAKFVSHYRTIDSVNFDKVPCSVNIDIDIVILNSSTL